MQRGRKRSKFYHYENDKTTPQKEVLDADFDKNLLSGSVKVTQKFIFENFQKDKSDFIKKFPISTKWETKWVYRVFWNFSYFHALYHALIQRTIRQRKCSSNGPMLRRTSLLGAIDTVRQWRDTLLSINRERNEECSKGGVTVIEDAIEKDREKFLYQNYAFRS